jgi:hypothetical protein
VDSPKIITIHTPTGSQYLRKRLIDRDSISGQLRIVNGPVSQEQ